ncbi:MAG: hypothetical protein KDC26_07565 [Armatimonadetes bacterium]|nr:hypothetical protein [Armatimonadota bacterium]
MICVAFLVSAVALGQFIDKSDQGKGSNIKVTVSATQVRNEQPLIWVGETARDAFRRAQKNKFDFNGTLIVSRTFESGYKGSFKVEFNRKKQLKVTVLQPLSEQGRQTIDDFTTVQSYFPASNQIVVQPSAYAALGSSDFRLNLAEKNYRISGGEKVEFNRRTTIEVILEPKSRGLYKRRLLIDSTYPVMMLYEILEGNKTISTVQDAILIETDRGSSERFSFNTQGAEVVKTWGPKEMKDPKASSGLLGFLPRQKKSLPYGFAVVSEQIVGSAEAPAFAVRLSNGMATVTVYQWDTEDGGRRSFEGLRPSSIDRDGVGYAVVGDEPDAVCLRILKEFVK